MEAPNYIGYIDQTNKVPGTGVAEGLESLLQNLAQHKAHQYKTNLARQAFQSQGVDPHTSNWLAQLEPKDAISFLKPKNSYEDELKREKFEEQKRARQFEEQEKIKNSFSKRIEQNAKDYELGVQLERVANEMMQAHEEMGNDWSPQKESATNALHKLSGGFIDRRSNAGKAAEKFRNKANEYVTLSLNAVKGIPSKYRGQLLEAAKPGLHMSPEAREQAIQSALKSAKANQIGFEEEQKILEGNEGMYPRDFNNQLLDRSKQRYDEIFSTDQEYATEDDAIQAAKDQGLNEFEITGDDGEEYIVRFDNKGNPHKFKKDSKGQLKRIK